MDDFFNEHNAERLRAADTLLLGGTCYELFKGFWPKMKDDPNAADVVREISRLNDAIEKVVVSDSITQEQTEPWHTTTRIVRRRDIDAQLTELKRQRGREILTFGSRTLWLDLLKRGLVDELHMMVGGALLGAGTPLMQTLEQDTPRVPLELLGVRTSKASNNLILRYSART
jgi:dihydrofolate reductase